MLFALYYPQPIKINCHNCHTVTGERNVKMSDVVLILY